MKLWLKVLLWIIIIGGLVGGTTYYVVNSKAQKDKDNLQTQIDALNIKLTAAQKSLADAQAKTTTTTTSTPAATAATPTTDPTASWKAYTNSFYNFTFKYPAANELKVVSPTSGSLDSVSSSRQDPDVYVMGLNKSDFMFGFLSEGAGYSVTDNELITWLKLSNIPVGLKAMEASDFTVKKNVTIAGKSATKVSIAAGKLGGQSDAYDFYFIQANDETYRITVDSTILGSQILPTFQFTK